jgi:hypothetical protein
VSLGSTPSGALRPIAGGVGSTTIRTYVPGKAAGASAPPRWERHALDVTIAAAEFPVACRIPGADGTETPHRYGATRFWRPVPGSNRLRAVRSVDLPALLGTESADPWPANPFRLADGTPPGLLPDAPASGAADRSTAGLESAIGLARSTCAGLRTIDGVLHEAVPEPRVILELVPAGSVLRLSVSFAPHADPSPRRMPFRLDAFEDLMRVASGVASLSPLDLQALRGRRPRIVAKGIYTDVPVAIPPFGPTRNLGSLPETVRRTFDDLLAVPGDDVGRALRIAGTLDALLIALPREDACVAHGVHWLRTEIALFLASRRTPATGTDDGPDMSWVKEPASGVSIEEVRRLSESVSILVAQAADHERAGDDEAARRTLDRVAEATTRLARLLELR